MTDNIRHLFSEGGGWGNRIEWFNWETRKVVGWKTPKPQVGDLLHALMESGKVGEFEFTTVEPCGDPQDMFFATVKDIGYKR